MRLSLYISPGVAQEESRLIAPRCISQFYHRPKFRAIGALRHNLWMALRNTENRTIDLDCKLFPLEVLQYPQMQGVNLRMSIDASYMVLRITLCIYLRMYAKLLSIKI